MDTGGLKQIIMSSRANVFLLERCRVHQKEERLIYLAEGKKDENYEWNIPIANTSVLLLGQGTSITQPAIRLLSKAGVCVMFVGTGGSPFLGGMDVSWILPTNEYGPTEYCIKSMKRWLDENERIEAGRRIQLERLENIKKFWVDSDLGFSSILDENVLSLFEEKKKRFEEAKNLSVLLGIEGDLTKKLYKIATSKTTGTLFVRDFEGGDRVNQFLNMGNYLAYGLAGVAIWTLGIPFSLSVLHGKERRGGFVFDIADLIKDGIVLPWAFRSASEGMTSQEFRQNLLKKMNEHKILDYMFNYIKNDLEK